MGRPVCSCAAIRSPVRGFGSAQQRYHSRRFWLLNSTTNLPRLLSPPDGAARRRRQAQHPRRRGDAETAQADAVIAVAVGATISSACPYADENDGKRAVEVLLGEKHCGSRVVMSRRGLVGCETTLWLAQNGKEVTVVEMLDNILASGKPVPHMNKDMLINLMKQAGVKVVTSSSLLEVTKEGAVVIDKKFRKSLIPADTVVMAAGFAPNNQLFKELYGEIGNLCNVGDSEAASNIMDAVWTANEVALNI
ncbi:MAG: FAD-dependent oxidoreductase [Cloacibacillus evryensis]